MRLAAQAREKEKTGQAADAEFVQQLRKQEPQFSCWLDEIKRMDPAAKLVHVKTENREIGRSHAQRIGAVLVRASASIPRKVKRV